MESPERILFTILALFPGTLFIGTVECQNMSYYTVICGGVR
jgi:hypothetical protein